MTKKRCFVISPIGADNSDTRMHADAVFNGIIKPAIEKLKADGFNLEPFRSDHLQEPGQISGQMFREIFQGDLCIALLTYFNPNVFYELAVAQCAYRPVVALLQEGQQPPFDVADLRTVSYDLVKSISDPRYMEELAGHLRTLLDEGWSPPDPFGANAPEAWEVVRDQSGLQKLIETSRPSPLSPGVDSVYRLPGVPDRQIIIRTGDIRDIRDIDVVVSSENTDLQLARYHDRSVSSTLRYFDAERGVGGGVKRDALDEKLKTLIQEYDIRLPVMSGAVIALPTTGLLERGIRYVFLAATVRGDGPGRGYSAVGQGETEHCIRECFLEFDKRASNEQLTSMLFPVFGAGTAKEDPEKVVAWLLPVIIQALKNSQSCRQVSILAWIESHRLALRNVAASLGLQREGGNSPS